MISIIAAMGKNRELGFEGAIPWHLPDDLKRFKQITRGHAVIMGRKTFQSIGKPLPERENIVITRQGGYSAPGCVVAASMEEALRDASRDNESFIIGGAEIYKLGLPYADRLYLTVVDVAVPADTFFPEFDESEWSIAKMEPHPADEKHPYPFVFEVYDRIKKQ